MNVMTKTGRFVIDPPPAPALPVEGGRSASSGSPDLLRRPQLCRARHRDGRDPNREAPFFFQKNPDTLVLDGRDFPYPARSNNVHHEIEMVVALGSRREGHPGRERAGVGLRLRSRAGHDAPRPAGRGKKLGRPWEIARPSNPQRREPDRSGRRLGHPAQGAIWLDVNGERRQTGDLNQMIWKVPEMITYLSGLFTPQRRRPHHVGNAVRRRRGVPRRRP